MFLRAASGFSSQRGFVELMWPACRLPDEGSYFSLAIPRFLAFWAYGAEGSRGQPQIFPTANHTHLCREPGQLCVEHLSKF